MTNVLQYDLCVLGGGGAGLVAARTAARLGAKVVIVEKRALGGAYLTQTIPVQAFCAAALQTGGVQAAKIDFVRVRIQALAAIKDFARDYAPEPLSASGIALIRALGSFSGPARVEAGGQLIAARHFILATGATPAHASWTGQELIRPLALEDVLTIDRPPEDLIIVGANFQGLVLAQALLRLGTKVSLIEPGAILPDEDPELVAPVLAQLAREGLRVFAQHEIARLEPISGGLRLYFKGGAAPLESQRIAFAANSLPLLEGLGLKNAGVTYANSGILSDARGRTSNRKIHVVGDAAGGPGSSQSALGQAERLAAHLFGHRRLASPIARILGTDPEMAIVGVTEAQARKKHNSIRILRATFADTDWARLTRMQQGHVKIVTNSASIIMGAGLVGPGVRELAGIFSVAIDKRMKASELSVVANAPALTQAISEAALASTPYLGKALPQRLFPRRAR
jgi:pyruvate/2-oxoglutarate dehydrogenase complex dihydrolipoamide dehydrogenase (E3) component